MVGHSVNDVHIDSESGDVYVVGAYRFDLHAEELYGRGEPT